MKLPLTQPRNQALTLIELMVVLAIVVLIAALVLPAWNRAGERARRIRCVSYLKQIGLGLHIFASDHTNAFPAGVRTNFGGAKEYVQVGEVFRHFLCISNELSTPLILTCLSDTRKPARNWSSLSKSNVSYFLNLDANEEDPTTILAGDRNLFINGKREPPGPLTLTTNSLVTWDKDMHRESGNILFGDGHVDKVSTARLLEQVRVMEIPTNRLLIP